MDIDVLRIVGAKAKLRLWQRDVARKGKVGWRRSSLSDPAERRNA
jgi:hypothetical protein